LNLEDSFASSLCPKRRAIGIFLSVNPSVSSNSRKPPRIPDSLWEAFFGVRKFIVIFFLAFLLCGISSPLFAQSRMEAGIFLDYLSISQTGSNNFGLGGRFGYRIHRHVMLEGELAYDYGINFNETYRNIASGNIAAIERTSIGVTHGLIGPAVEPAKGWFRPFATLKAGFMDFRLSPSLLPVSNAVSTLLGIRTSSLNVAVYPGAGLEAILGPVGLRLESGDEIYLNGGAHNNLRITFGPVVRF
jgi:hypothetical protein